MISLGEIRGCKEIIFAEKAVVGSGNDIGTESKGINGGHCAYFNDLQASVRRD